MPPTRLPITGRCFHIASVTVRPNPSARLFCTTTSARRWIALTIAPFSSRSAIGRPARWTRRRIVGGSAARWAQTSDQTSAPSGSSATAAASGPGEQQVRRLGRAELLGEAIEQAVRILQAVPAGDLGDEPGGGRDRLVLDDLGAALDPPRGCRRRGRRREPSSAPSAASPTATRIARADSGSRSWFFGEKGSIDGRHQPAAGALQPGPDEALAGEDAGSAAST